MKKNLLTCLFLFILIVSIFAAETRVSLSDFIVHSDNTRYKYMGKGISEMISVELQKSPGVDLVEREQREQILEEMNIYLSGISDSETHVEPGKLMIARFIVFGEIIYMDKDVFISLRMIDVESGKVVWNQKITEKLSKYDYISGYFASSILEFLSAEVSNTTMTKVEVKKEKSEDAVIAFSNAVDYYDKKEMEKARKELSITIKIDPESEAAEFYLSKLITNTTKFKIMTEQYISYQNPAYLGVIRTDRFHYSHSQALTKDRTWLYVPNPESPSASNRQAAGGILSFGYKTSDYSSIGFSLSAYNRTWRGYDQNLYPADEYYFKPDSDWSFGFSPGFLYRNKDESFVFDTRLAYSNGKIVPINGDYTDDVDVSNDYILEDKVNLPLFWENTFTWAFNNRNTFFVLKQLNDISIDRIYYFGRFLPAIEHFPMDWFSLRAGIEGSFAVFNDSRNAGFGGMGGITFRIPGWGLDIDLNFTYRKRPSRVIEGIMFTDYIFLLSGTLSDVFISRN
ncbi:MAG: hypothetical protein PF693_02820 [Spirochaetia bacterium]|jgi:TolB-like protein|nr:hypothetical protein [Spirochaetia bacterium]